MAYSIKKHIQQLIYLLKVHSFSDVVVCPGSRNMPIVESMCCGISMCTGLSTSDARDS